MELEQIEKEIKSGDFVSVLQLIKESIPKWTKSGECLYIARLLSKYSYSHDDTEEDVFNEITKIIDICYQCLKKLQFINSDVNSFFKSIYYIITLGLKKKYVKSVLHLLHIFCKCLVSCDTSSKDNLSMISRTYFTTWNLSVTQSNVTALMLQKFSLQLLLYSNVDLDKYFQQAQRCSAIFLQNNKSDFNSIHQFFCDLILQFKMYILSNAKFDTKTSIVPLFNLLIEYCNTLIQFKQTSSYSNFYRSLVADVEKKLDAESTLALKISTKLSEVAIIYPQGQCDSAIVLKLIKGTENVPHSYSADYVIVSSLLQIMNCYHINGIKKLMDFTIVKLIYDIITKRSLCHDVLKIKLFTTINIVLSSLVTFIQSQEDKKCLREAVIWLEYCTDMEVKSKDSLYIYNLGINTGNLGMISFKSGEYTIATKFTQGSIMCFEEYMNISPEESKSKLKSSIERKYSLLSDCYRYNNDLDEAVVTCAKSYIKGFCSKSDFIAYYVKCRKIDDNSTKSCFKNKTIRTIINLALLQCPGSENSIDGFQLLWDELKTYLNSSTSWPEEILACGLELEKSKNLYWKLQGLLVICRYKWYKDDDSSTGEPASYYPKAVLSFMAKQKKFCDDLVKRFQAEAFFWQFMCNIKEVETLAEKQLTAEEKAPKSMTALATDPGEEEQLNDACDVRTVVSSLTFENQALALNDLENSLKLWQFLIKKDVQLHDVDLVCDYVTSIGHVYKFYGLLSLSVQSWVLLNEIASKYSVNNSLLRSYRELLFLVPEIIPEKMLNDIKGQLKDGNNTDPHNYTLLSTKLALSYYYYKIGDIENGVVVMNHLLNGDHMTRTTLRSTEIQALIYYVSSMYTNLPKGCLPKVNYFKFNCLGYSMYASRCAIGLLEAAKSLNHECLCWKHHISWLHHMTGLQYARLGLTSGQPRIVRAYLKHPLILAQKFSIPFRTAEALALLAEVDLLTDKFDDCRTKVDCLMDLLDVHKPAQQYLNIKEKEELMKTPTKYKSPKDKATSEGPCFRDCESPFKLPVDVLNDGILHIGQEERITLFTKNGPNLLTSPSVTHREDKHKCRHSYGCRLGVVNCGVCSSPALPRLISITYALMANLHAFAGRTKSAQDCIDLANATLLSFRNKSVQINTRLSSLLNTNSLQTSHQLDFVKSRLCLSHLYLKYHYAQILAISRNFDEATSCNLSALSIADTLDTTLLRQCKDIIDLLIVQGQRLNFLKQSNHQETLDKQVEAINKKSTILIETSKAQPNKNFASTKTSLKHCTSEDDLFGDDDNVVESSPVNNNIEQRPITPPNAPLKPRIRRGKTRRKIIDDDSPIKENQSTEDIINGLSCLEIDEDKAKRKFSIRYNAYDLADEVNQINLLKPSIVKKTRGRPKKETTKNGLSSQKENDVKSIKSSPRSPDKTAENKMSKSLNNGTKSKSVTKSTKVIESSKPVRKTKIARSLRRL